MDVRYKAKGIGKLQVELQTEVTRDALSRVLISQRDNEVCFRATVYAGVHVNIQSSSSAGTDVTVDV